MEISVENVIKKYEEVGYLGNGTEYRHIAIKTKDNGMLHLNLYFKKEEVES